MPDIAKINGVDASSVGSIASISGVTYANDHSIFGQTVSMLPDAHTLLSTTTISSSTSNVTISSDLDSTYEMYEFHFKNIHGSANSTLQFQANLPSQTGFDEYMITTYWYNSSSNMAYNIYGDQGTETNWAYRIKQYQYISPYTYGGDYNQSSTSGILVTDRYHFWSTLTKSSTGSSGYTDSVYVSGIFGGYFDEIDFKMTAGNIDSGEIDLYGVATS